MDSITDRSISLANELRSIAADMEENNLNFAIVGAGDIEDVASIREAATIVATFVQHEGDIGRARAEGVQSERISLLRTCATWAREIRLTRTEFAAWLEQLATAWERDAKK